MKITFLKELVGLALLFSVLLTSGCSSRDQIPLNTPTASSVAMPSATNIPAPTAIVSPTIPTSETTPVPVELSSQSTTISIIDKASFVSENYPDNSILKPGEDFVKTFEIKNIGVTTWTMSYTLVLDSTSQKNTLGSPLQVNFSQQTLPGNSISLQIPLTAPSSPGTYTVYWLLKNENGETIPVGNSNNIWVTILVCDPAQPCSPLISGGGVAASGISASLTNFTSGTQSTTASFCMTLPNRNYGPTPGTISLLVDQQTVWASTGGSLDVGCFEFEFPVTASQFQQAKTVALSISQVRIIGGPNDPNGACQVVRPNLMTQHPGLDFRCHFTMAGYYTNLQVPAGMTAEQAGQIITDAVEGAVYGPWVLNVK